MAENKNVYICSIEASDIYEHQLGRPIKPNMVGMMPYSLDLEKFKKFGGKVFVDKREKNKTLDVINVKFNRKVKGSDYLLEKCDISNIEDKLLELTEKSNSLKTKTEQKKNDYAIVQQSKFLNYLKNAEDYGWSSYSSDELREMLYEKGFTYNGEEYVVFKRTSSKSRTGQCQFIKKKLKDKMQRWARLGMNMDGLSLSDGVDFPSLLAYESLVSSGIIGTIKINPDNILVVSDIVSKFNIDTNVIKSGEDGFLDSFYVKDYKMESDIFDGENILDEMYFQKSGKSSMLLREHMFKSCSYNGRVVKFLKDNCPDGQLFEEWKLTDYFGNEIYAKDVHMITTPNSLKFLKFYKRKKTKALMYEHWKKKVKEEDCVFGICKYEKKTKRGFDENSKPLNRLSYQMINSLDIQTEELNKLAEYELDYINNLKNNDDVYIEFLKNNNNDTNANDMLVDIYNKNKNIVNTLTFKNKRKNDILSYTNEIRRGKIRTVGDYCNICQNPKELMYHAIGKLPNDNGVLDIKKWRQEMELVENECFSSLHEFGRDYVAFRSPNTSPSNVLVVRNVKSKFIEEYINYSDNVIYLNAIEFELNRILSGSDVDGDTVVVFDNKTLLKSARRCYRKYNVCENSVNATKVNYSVNNANMARIDNTLSTSQMYIGRVVNLGQHCMSAYWEEKRKNGDTDRAKKLLKTVDVCTVLSEIAIDMAKKMYDIDFGKEIKNIENILSDNNKPLFFKYISKNERSKLRYYNTPMDDLYKIADNIPKAEYLKTESMLSLLKRNDFKITKKTKRQHEKFHGIIDAYIQKRNEINKMHNKPWSKLNDDEKKEKYELLDEATYQCSYEMKKYKISEPTIYYILDRMFNKKLEKNEKMKIKEVLTYMNVIYNINPEKFLSTFKTF